jgi:DNA-formamidopyrimidine glycosylase
MPEGPEVLGYSLFLARRLHGATLVDVDIMSGKYAKKHFKGYALLKQALPTKVTDIGTKGKFMFVRLANGLDLFVSHGMTGYWTDDAKAPHNRVAFRTRRGTVFYNDMRNFGTIQAVPDEGALAAKLDSLGPDVLDDAITQDAFYSRMRRFAHKKIGILLSDQKVVSGIGNYLRSDILWYARISPHRRFQDIKPAERARLFDTAYNLVRFHAIPSMARARRPFPSLNRTQLRHAVERSPAGDFFVYGQERDADGARVTREKMGSRTVHWVRGRQR